MYEGTITSWIYPADMTLAEFKAAIISQIEAAERAGSQWFACCPDNCHIIGGRPLQDGETI